MGIQPNQKAAHGMEAEGRRQSNACGYAKCVGGNPPQKPFFYPSRVKIKLSSAYRRRRRMTSSAAPSARGRPGAASAVLGNDKPPHPRYRGDDPKRGKRESKTKKPAHGMEADGRR